MTDLKPCPFCGADPKVPENTARAPQRPSWEISCSQYCIAMHRGSQKQVIADWNKRAEESK